jgi:hypothetical protein
MATRFRRLCALAATGAAIAAAGCASANHSASPPTTASARPVSVTALPTTTHSLKSRLVARIPITSPDGLVEVGGAIWVKTDDGRVVRVDPNTNKVTARIRVDTATDPNHYCQGIGTDGNAVWACRASDSGTGIVRIDPNSLTTGKTVRVNKIFSQLTLPHTSRGIWVLTGTGQAITVVNPTNGAMTSYPLGAHCVQVAAAEAVVVATCADDNMLVALQPNTGSVLKRVHLPAPGIAAISGHDIWVDTAKGLMRLNFALSIQAIYPHQIVGREGDLAVTDDAVWVRTPGCVLWRIDQGHNVVSEHLTTRPAISAGSLLVTTDAIWASANNEGVVLRLRR